jgi:hypothetical protein
MGRGFRRDLFNRERFVFQNSPAQLGFRADSPADDGTPGNHQDDKQKMPIYDMPSGKTKGDAPFFFCL